MLGWTKLISGLENTEALLDFGKEVCVCLVHFLELKVTLDIQ